MSKVPQTVLLLIGLLAIQSYNVDAAYTMNETCQYYGNGYIGDPSNCQGWGYCQDGVLLSLGSCSPGYFYDMSTATCDVESKVVCRTNIRNACSSLSAPQILMNPDNCQQYCYCSSSISPYCASCPINQIFDTDSQDCIRNINNSCPVDSVCRLVPDNSFVADPNNCGGYLTCEGGLGVVGQCSSGMGYNPLTGYCSSTYFCDGNSFAETLPNNPSACVVYDTYTDTIYIADSQTCFGFYICTSVTGPGTWSKCPFGTHFNPDVQQCVTPYTYACPYNRCGNLNLTFVNKIDTACGDYTVCNNQMSGSSGKCSNVNKNYPYFDEYYGTCMTVNPSTSDTNFVVC